MRSKIFIFLIFSLFLFSFVSATTYQQNTATEFTTSCQLINCSDGDIYLTIIGSDGSMIINNQNTTKNVGFISLSLNSTQTSEIDEYQFFLSSDTDYYSSSFKITPTGEEGTTSKAIFYIGVLFLLLVLFVASIYGTAASEQIWGKTLLSGLAYLLMIAITFISWNMSANFMTTAPFMIEFLRILFIVLMVALFPVLVGLFSYGVYMMLQVDEIKKLQEQGYSIDEASEKVSKRRKF